MRVMARKAYLKDEIATERSKHQQTMRRVDRLMVTLDEVHFGPPVEREAAAVERHFRRKDRDESD